MRGTRSNGGKDFKPPWIHIATTSGLCFLPNRHHDSLHLISLVPLGLRFSLGRGLRRQHKVQTSPGSNKIAALPFISTFHAAQTVPGQPRILSSFPFSSQSVIVARAPLINFFPYIISCSSPRRDLAPLRLTVKILFHFPCKAVFVERSL